jgi:hypothetical protein
MKFRSHRWLVWLLPFLVARAFVPAGFMLSAGADGLSLAFCHGTTPVVQFAAAQQDASGDQGEASEGASHADHHQHAQHSEDGQHHSDHFSASDTGVCPFAVVAATSAGSEFFSASIAFASTDEFIPDYTAPPNANRPIRADRIRGPPIVFLT